MTLRHSMVGRMARNSAQLQRLKSKAYDEDETGEDVWETCCNVRLDFPKQVGAIYANREIIENYRQVGRNIQLAEMQDPGFMVTNEMRLLVKLRHGTAYYNIRGVENIEGRNRRIQLVVTRETG